MSPPYRAVSPNVDDLYGLPRYGGERDGHADELAAAFSGLTVDEEGWWSHDFWAPQFRDLSLERDDLLVSGR